MSNFEKEILIIIGTLIGLVIAFPLKVQNRVLTYWYKAGAAYYRFRRKQLEKKLTKLERELHERK